MTTCTNERHFWTATGDCQCGELHRCCASRSKSQCKHRAVEGDSWCKRCAPAMRAADEQTNAAIRAEAAEDHSEEDED